jgi:hypothetical protein
MFIIVAFVPYISHLSSINMQFNLKPIPANCDLRQAGLVPEGTSVQSRKWPWVRHGINMQVAREKKEKEKSTAREPHVSSKAKCLGLGGYILSFPLPLAYLYHVFLPSLPISTALTTLISIKERRAMRITIR